MPTPPYTIRPYAPRDEAPLLALGPRFLAGSAPWFEPAAFLDAVRKWTEGAITTIGPTRAVFVAEDAAGTCVGFVGVSRFVHFTGIEQAYVGELAVAAEAEGMGVGRALLSAAEAWAAEQGFAYVALDTGTANARARGFYEHLGYAEESVRLVKVLGRANETGQE